jgi:type IV pilus assembly protein PilW
MHTVFNVFSQSAKNRKGFTLIELMVAMAIASIVMAGIYAAYNAQMRTHVTQQAIVDIQQSLRGAMYFMQRSIRMAGYGNCAGFEDCDSNPSFSGLIEPYASAAPAIDSSTIAFTIDADDDGQIDGTDGGNIDNVDLELIAFRLNGNTIQKYTPSTDSWEALAENIAAISFVYLDENQQPLGDPPAPLTSIRSVEVSITAQPVEEVHKRASAKRPQILTAQIRCRNL